MERVHRYLPKILFSFFSLVNVRYDYACLYILPRRLNIIDELTTFYLDGQHQYGMLLIVAAVGTTGDINTWPTRTTVLDVFLLLTQMEA